MDSWEVWLLVVGILLLIKVVIGCLWFWHNQKQKQRREQRTRDLEERNRHRQQQLPAAGVNGVVIHMGHSGSSPVVPLQGYHVQPVVAARDLPPSYAAAATAHQQQKPVTFLYS